MICLIFVVIFLIIIVCYFLLRQRNDQIDSDEVWNNTTKTLEEFKELMDERIPSAQEECLEEDDARNSDKNESENVNFVPDQLESELKSKLEESVLSREIKELVHFTRIDNLQSILSIGLQSRVKLEKRNQKYLINDSMRLDNRLNGISISITHPNQSMFYKYRTATESSDWCVVILKPSILWELSCLFCMHNAADSRIRRLNDKSLSNKDAFLSMFSSENRSSILPKNYTTDVQAEVLCLNDIPVEYIEKIALLSSNNNLINGAVGKSFEVIVDKKYFNTREYNLNLIKM